jgi:two-component system, chemotaxis family, protein-glutamate methylesterase/glutaminase
MNGGGATVIKVLVVDDSSFFRRRIAEILSSHRDITIVGTAINGVEAVAKTMELKPDVITMDYEMPTMDGITAVRLIMHQRPTPILMFSSLTYEGARVTLDALDAGAVDYLPKNFESIDRDAKVASRILHDRIMAVVRSKNPLVASRPGTAAKENVMPGARPQQTCAAATSLSARNSAAENNPAPARPVKKPQILAIGASTGGPVALQTVLKGLPQRFPVPVLIIQHMPAAFTGAFAERLNRICPLNVKEAEDDEHLVPGTVYLAPGGKQMLVSSEGKCIRIVSSDSRLHYQPSVDVAFGSLAKSYPGRVLALVLTGMGTDGREGARLLKQGGSTIWTQDEASCVVYGMPAAVANAQLSDATVKLAEMAGHIAHALLI